MTMLSKRKFLAASAGLTAASLLPLRADPMGKPIGIQLYTVAGPMKEDLRGTLQKIAEIGYREVETAGFGGVSAAEFRKLLDDVGLKCASCHLPLADGDDPRMHFDNAGAVGARYAIASTMTNHKTGKNGLDVTNSADRSDFDRTVAEMNRLGEAARKSGLVFGYHNHDFEFKKFADGKLVWDEVLANTDKDTVKIEIDCGWMVLGGYDPVEYMKKHPGRIKLLHIKDFVASTPRPSTTTKGHQGTELGTGFIDYKPIFAAAKAAGVEHYFVEQEPPFLNMPALEAARADYDYLHKLS
jgi:sugar phosphate isomerase/epimerase